MNTELQSTLGTELRWVVSQSASCFHAAEAIRRGRGLADAKLAKAVRPPAERLQSEIQVLGPVDELFWSHLVPLSAGIENNRQLVELVLQKIVGTHPTAEAMVGPLAARLADVEAAVRQAIPGLVDEVASRAEHLRGQWRAYGPLLLGRVARLTDQRIIVPTAEVILVHPALGGGGAAHLPYNTVRIEAVRTDPIPKLPELLRLVWMISQLNIDLPLFSETIHRDRLPLAARLAILPAVLVAAEEMEMADYDPQAVRLALGAWHVDGPQGVDLADAVCTWWQSHMDLQPHWNVALASLDRMIG